MVRRIESKKSSEMELLQKEMEFLERENRVLREKQKSLGLPERLKVENRACKVWRLNWIYDGFWLSWGEKNFDRPWGGKWRFQSYDGRVVVRWDWGKNWELLSTGSVTIDWKDFEIKRSYTIKGESFQIARLEARGKASGGRLGYVPYVCEIGSDFKINKITYHWVDLNLTQEWWKIYLTSRAGKLEIWWWRFSRNRDGAACWIAEVVARVKRDPKILDHFEVSPSGQAVQADFKNKLWDDNILNDCYQRTWIPAIKLVSWLNASRKDFGI